MHQIYLKPCRTKHFQKNKPHFSSCLALNGEEELEEEEEEDKDEKQLELSRFQDLLLHGNPQLMHYTSALRSHPSVYDAGVRDSKEDVEMQRGPRGELMLDSHIGIVKYCVIYSFEKL